MTEETRTVEIKTRITLPAESDEEALIGAEELCGELRPENFGYQIVKETEREVLDYLRAKLEEAKRDYEEAPPGRTKADLKTWIDYYQSEIDKMKEAK